LSLITNIFIKEDDMTTVTDQLGQQAKEVAEDLQNMGATVRDAAQEKLGQMGDKASEYYEQGQDRVRGVGCACQQFVQQRPLTSLLLAAGVGVLLGCFWKRR
jgi:ElaB/YqjD/DUF883 family membrane-anchored ribosome-binding protein